jgi:hypothetical protein
MNCKKRKKVMDRNEEQVKIKEQWTKVTRELRMKKRVKVVNLSKKRTRWN